MWGADEHAPTQLRYTNDIVAVAARSFAYSCEEHANATRICWPAELTGSRSINLSAAQQVAMSLGDPVCILGQDGTVACADSGSRGIPPLDRFTPVEGLGGEVSAVALGPDRPAHGCAIKQDRSLWCWGVGILGDGMPSRDTPAPAIGIEAVRGVVERVALGDTSTCVVTTPGAVACWGPIVDPAAPRADAGRGRRRRVVRRGHDGRGPRLRADGRRANLVLGRQRRDADERPESRRPGSPSRAASRPGGRGARGSAAFVCARHGFVRLVLGHQ